MSTPVPNLLIPPVPLTDPLNVNVRGGALPPWLIFLRLVSVTELLKVALPEPLKPSVPVPPRVAGQLNVSFTPPEQAIVPSLSLTLVNPAKFGSASAESSR